MLTDHHDILTLSFDSHLQAVIMSWNGFASSSEFRAANEQVLKLLSEKNCHNIIADCREMKIISLTDQQWLYQDWIPRATQAGLK